MNISTMRMLRMMRLARIARMLNIGRLFRVFRSFNILVFSLYITLKTVGWAFLLLTCNIYVFALILRQGTGEHVNSADVSTDFVIYWGSLPDCMFTLFKAITGGVSWHDCVQPLAAVPRLWTYIFVAYVSFTQLAVLNVITGVFCESAIEGAATDRSLAVQKHKESKRQYIDEVHRLFGDIDVDGSRVITLHEFLKHYSEEDAKAFFASLEIDSDNAWEVFRLLDMDESGSIGLDEFVEGCVNLRGEAKSLDMAKLLKMGRKADEKISLIYKHQQDITDELLSKLLVMEQQQPAVSVTSTAAPTANNSGGLSVLHEL